jgi:hypothetical protein
MQTLGMLGVKEVLLRVFFVGEGWGEVRWRKSVMIQIRVDS